MTTATHTTNCHCGHYHPKGVKCAITHTAAQPADHSANCTCQEHLHTEGEKCACDDDEEHEHNISHAPNTGHDHHDAHHHHDHDHTPATGANCDITTGKDCTCCGDDHPVFQITDAAPINEASDTRAVYRILNMDCPVEEALIRKKLNGMPGITGLDFNLMQRVLTVDHTLSDTSSIEKALLEIDMTPEAITAANRSATADALPATKIPWKKLGLACVFAALAEISHLMYEWEAAPLGLDINNWQIGGITVMAWLPLAMALIAILLSGLTTYKKGWLAVKNFNLNINALMAVAVTGAFIIKQYPEAAMVMVLFNIAEALEAKSLDKARNAIKNLLNLTPEKATVKQADGSWLETDIKQVAIDSLVRVRPGERIALDGIIVDGQSTVNQTPITGESMPVEKNIGDEVFAGTINEAGSFEFKVTARADNSTLARIIHAVEEAQGSRAPIQRFVDKFAGIYTPAVFIIALLTAVVPPLLLGGAWMHWIYTALVLLVIGCPCALVISTPVTIVSGMAAATRHGILVKGGMYLEQGRKLKYLALDKTGTITHGKPQQTDFVSLNKLAPKTARTLALSLTNRSDHPVSKAIAQAALAAGFIPLDVTDFTAVGGQGVTGVIEGQTWLLGNHRMVEEVGKCSPQLEEQLFALEKQGKSVVALIGEQGVEALFAVADTIKDSSIEAISELKSMGVNTVMLTGDNVHTAEVIAKQADVDAFEGELLPTDKLAKVAELTQKGVTGMVGDGINDAPALVKADIGFAMAAFGTDTAIESADVALMDDDLRKIPRFIKLSMSTYAILVQNITLALGIKAVFIGLTFAGLATMWMAVFADVGASLIVVANGLRAMRK